MPSFEFLRGPRYALLCKEEKGFLAGVPANACAAVLLTPLRSKEQCFRRVVAEMLQHFGPAFVVATIRVRLLARPLHSHDSFYRPSIPARVHPFSEGLQPVVASAP